jgi:uncharacterized protein YndB with AHSA1/START domain
MTPSTPSPSTPSPSTQSPSESSATEAPVTASVRIAAPPDVVFLYFTDPALAVKWIADSAYLDARPGGTFSIDVRGNPARGQYLEVDPPRRVVFTWGIEESADLPPGSSTVEVVLEPDGDGTVVTLTHRDLPTAEFRRSHQEGWTEFLGLLTELLRTVP